jgi:hypothetical protein
MKNPTTAICWIASAMLMVQGPLLAGRGGFGGGGFHGGSIGNAGHVANRPYYSGGYYGYAMGPTTFEGDEGLNSRGSGSAPPVAGTGTGGGPPEQLQDGRGVYVSQGATHSEGPSWDSDWWAQDPRSEAEIAAAAAATDVAVGSLVPSLPRDYDTLYAANARYYFAEGTFYQAAESGYQVVAPPIGIEVQQLPRTAEMVTVKSQQDAVCNDSYYQALYGGSGIVYKVVEDPQD